MQSCSRPISRVPPDGMRLPLLRSTAHTWHAHRWQAMSSGSVPTIEMQLSGE